VTKDAVALVTKEDWEGFCRYTETVESQYWERDGILPDVIDPIVIYLNPGSDRKNSDTNSQSDCDNSETASQYNNTMLMKTLTWSLHSHYTVSSQCFCFGSSR
jgi:hypothetical protein